MKLIYWLLIIALLYYIINKIVDVYSTNEHFDPSLVPVSSIVTLAKVAQKIVTGNGELRNPGNLYIAAKLGVDKISTFNDNVTISKNGLTVTGPITQSGGNVTLDGNTTNTGSFTVTGTTDVTSNITANGTINTSKDNGVIFKTSNNSNNYKISADDTYLNISNEGNNILSFGQDGSIYGKNGKSGTGFSIDPNSNVSTNNITVTNNINMIDDNNRVTLSIVNNSGNNAFQFGDGTDGSTKFLRFQNNKSTPEPILDIYENGIVDFKGSLKVGGKSFTDHVKDAFNTITT